MQEAVRDVGTVIDWMGGTRALLERDDPQFKAVAMQKLGLTDAQWEEKRAELLTQLNNSMANAQSHVNESIKAGISPQARPYVPADKFGATFQSAIEEHLNDRVTSGTQAEAAGVSVPYGPPEKFDSGDAGWAIVVVARLDEAFGGKHVFVHSSDPSAFRYNLSSPNTTVALFADWATGEPPALSIKAAIESQTPEYTIHLGDTYYAGFEDEIRHNLVACWPGTPVQGKSFALNGNHEMYSGGNAYFNALPLFGHSASYFNLGNQYWRLIALDTSYPERSGSGPASSWGELVDMDLSDGTHVSEVDWLAAQVAHARSFNPPAKIILLTHHQLFSAFDGDDLGQYLKPQIQRFVDQGAIYAWFWGHEHRGIVYGPNATGNFKARCIGHAGFPEAPSHSTDAAHKDQYPIVWMEERTEPANAWYGMRGFALLRLEGPEAGVDYIDQTGAKVYSERL